jgi:hypothetical protein
MNFLMKPALVFASGLALAGCNTFWNDAVPLRNGDLRASSYSEASRYCEHKQMNARFIRKAPAEGGVDFRCESP